MPGFLIGNDVGDGPSSLVETARAHRWEVLILGDVAREVVDEFRFSAQTVSRPNFEADRITMHHRQNELYLPGKTRTGTVDFTLYERVHPGTGRNGAAAAVRSWWSTWMMNAGTYSLNMFGGTIQAMKRKIDIVQLDGCGVPIWTYRCMGAFPIKVDGSPLDYCSTDLSTISVTMSIDTFQEAQSF